ncbi:MAG: hypothetical protein COV45_06010 [Deltaproteobacteria bacterium CG11_big_fil_rev_8_21_14_0_20_47_16]|nr:MAG: hypothetical protein COV45_06010 [Deltaproteobacteria bacterium CG11_big_fil_rev_8_21_14_0_20_47_16]
MNQRNGKIFEAMKDLINGLRANVLQAGELVLAGDPDRFAKFRSQVLRLFGKTRGAEKYLNEFMNRIDQKQQQCGQATERYGIE